MKKFLLIPIITLLAILGEDIIYAQCSAVTSGVPTTNGRTYSSLPSCNNLTINMEAPPTGYLFMTNLETNGVYTVERTGGNGSNYLTARTTATGGTVFTHGTGPITFQVTTGTVANIVVTGSNQPTCATSWTGTSTVLQYRRVQPNIPNTPTISYNCAASQTTLTSGGGAVSGITPAYQWQGSNNNSTWTNIASATSTTYTITAATSPQYNYYRMVASYGSCTRPSASVSVIPQGTFSGNIVITQNTTIGGVFNITGDFTVNAGVIITVPQGCEFFVEANNVTINGTIDATASGNLGGSAGARGTSGNNLGCRSNANADAAGGIRGGNGVGPGRGLQPSANGGTGVGCGQDCKFDADYAGMVIGGGAEPVQVAEVHMEELVETVDLEVFPVGFHTTML